jgi:hypothetical protein
MTDFEKWPLYFPKVAESIQVTKQRENNFETKTNSYLTKSKRLRLLKM